MNILLTLLVSLFFISCKGSSDNNEPPLETPGQKSDEVVNEETGHEPSQTPSNPSESNNSGQDTDSSKSSDSNQNAIPSEVIEESESSPETPIPNTGEVNEPRQDAYSPQENKESEQNEKTSYMSKKGIVTVRHSRGQGTGFFIGPHTMVTAFHVIMQYLDSKSSVPDAISIIHPQTGRRIPVDFIQAIDVYNDVAILHVSKYEPPGYYKLFKGATSSLSSKKAYFYNHEHQSPPIVEGKLSTFETLDSGSMALPSHTSGLSLTHFRGLSGSPVFLEDGKVIGVFVQVAGHIAEFTGIQDVHDLLSQPSLNCEIAMCVQDKIDSDWVDKFFYHLFRFRFG